eukprot:365576-Chlamydomonas_euryale.AAC.1
MPPEDCSCSLPRTSVMRMTCCAAGTTCATSAAEAASASTAAVAAAEATALKERKYSLARTPRCEKERPQLLVLLQLLFRAKHVKGMARRDQRLGAVPGVDHLHSRCIQRHGNQHSQSGAVAWSHAPRARHGPGVEEGG